MVLALSIDERTERRRAADDAGSGVEAIGAADTPAAVAVAVARCGRFAIGVAVAEAVGVGVGVDGGGMWSAVRVVRRVVAGVETGAGGARKPYIRVAEAVELLNSIRNTSDESVDEVESRALRLRLATGRRDAGVAGGAPAAAAAAAA